MAGVVGTADTVRHLKSLLLQIDNGRPTQDEERASLTADSNASPY